MGCNDLMLALVSYPEPTSEAMLHKAIGIAKDLGARITAVAFEVAVPGKGTFVAENILGLTDLIEKERLKSESNACGLLERFQDLARKQGVEVDTILDRCSTVEFARRMSDHARFHDVTLAQAGFDEIQQFDVERIIFQSGRPVLVIPSAPSLPEGPCFERVVVAWDFGRAATRAVADALPILRRAKSIHLVTVHGEKAIECTQTTIAAAEYFARHGIAVNVEDVNMPGQPIGEVLTSYVASHRADLLVMGAYGHSRTMEFLLGGATQSMLAHPPVPIFMSH
jgi:nucleotide-binding universal stress UspA family protein